MLWRGAPDARCRRAASAFHLRGIAIYFGVLATWRVIGILYDGGSFLDAAAAVATFAVLAAGALSLLALIAWGVARTTVYTITNRRVVMRIGIALRWTFNLPYTQIDGAALRPYEDGTGDIPPAARRGHPPRLLRLWPHARPWHFTRPEPMLRCLPDAAATAQLLSEALAASLAIRSRRADLGTVPRGRAGRPWRQAEEDAMAQGTFAKADMRQGKHFPKPLLIGMGLMVVFSIAAAAFGRMTDIGTLRNPTTAPVSITRYQLLAGRRRDDHDRRRALRRDHQDTRPEEGGFLRGSLRGIDRDRKMRGIALEQPWRLFLWEDGALTLSDTVTGQRINLNGFGSTNAAAFAALLDTRERDDELAQSPVTQDGAGPLRHRGGEHLREPARPREARGRRHHQSRRRGARPRRARRGALRREADVFANGDDRARKPHRAPVDEGDRRPRVHGTVRIQLLGKADAMNAHAIPHASESAVNETTRIAQQDTLLTPRFYTTDFDALDKIDVTAGAGRMGRAHRGDALDPNRGHFRRTDEWTMSTSTTCRKGCARSSSTSW